jgi:ribosomal protein S2
VLGYCPSCGLDDVGFWVRFSEGGIFLFFFTESERVNLDTITKNTATLTDATKEVVLEVTTENTKRMLLSRHHSAVRNHDVKIAKRCSENVAQFRYLGTTVTNQNIIQEEIKRSLITSNAVHFRVNGKTKQETSIKRVASSHRVVYDR